MCFKGGTTSAPSARGLGILAFPESPRALGAEARGDSTKNRTPSEIEEVVWPQIGARHCRWRRVFRSATDREGPCLGPRARPKTPPTCRTGPQDSPPPSSGLIQTLTARPWRRRRPSASPGVWCLKVLHAVDAPPLTPPYNAPKLLADTSLDRRHIAGIAARSSAEHANSKSRTPAAHASHPRATAPQSHAPSLRPPSRAMHAPHCLQLMAAEG